ncbi:MAG: nucleotidyltransferase family protein [Alistipes sp.]
MPTSSTLLFSLLRSALWPTEEASAPFARLSATAWQEIYTLSVAQGVLALAYEGLLRLPHEAQPPRPLKIQWAYNVECIEKRYEQQRRSATEFAELYAQQHIRTLVLKGFGLSGYYPVPAHRPSGDLDCYLYGDYERGNRLMELAGAAVQRDFYKHSHITYRGLSIENHQYCIAIRGSRKMKELERYLERLLHEDPAPQCFENTQLLLPPAEFNALFLTKHALGHFVSEGLNVKQLCDWALFLSAEQNNIDFKRFYAHCDHFGFRTFVDAVTALAVTQLGLAVTNRDITTTSPHAEKIMDDMLHHRTPVFSTSEGVWRSRVALIRNMIANRWRYREICGTNALWEVVKFAFFFLFERHPKLGSNGISC